MLYLFIEDICGDTPIPPRHAKAYGNLLKLKQQVNIERLKALKAFKKDALSGKFPQKKQSVNISNQEFKKFLNLLN